MSLQVLCVFNRGLTDRQTLKVSMHSLLILLITAARDLQAAELTLQY